jgi:hypothetical protein
VSEEALNKAVSRAARAQKLLDDELLKEAHEAIERDLIRAWITSEPRDNDGRERVWNAVQANRKHKDFLTKAVNDGKLAQAELKQLAETAERKKRFGIL